MDLDAKQSSRKSGWHGIGRDGRINDLAHWLNEDAYELESLLESGGLTATHAEQLVENVVGRYALPFSVAPNFRINGRDCMIPMVIEEASVVAAAANAARIIRLGGGFSATSSGSEMIGQIQLLTDDPEVLALQLLENKEEWLELANEADPGLVAAGGGARDLSVRQLVDDTDGSVFLVAHLIVDVRDAMGANAVNSMAERLAELWKERLQATPVLRILSNLADRRTVTVEADVPLSALEADGFSAAQIRDRIVSATRMAWLDPYRAATHNKGIMNGVDAVLLATGNDWRAVEAGAHAYAARDGSYRSLSNWYVGDDGSLRGSLTLPMAVGIVGGATKVHPTARLALKILEAASAEELAFCVASAGLANNFAALRALATEGIQRGHMTLHGRSRKLVK